jgi:orotate phosphoribosyltransferase
MAWKQRKKLLENLAEGLVKAGALQFGTFSLSDGRESPYFLDLRSLASYPGTFRTVMEAMTSVAKAKAPRADAVCTAPLSGLIIASPMAMALGKPLVYTREQARRDERRIVGEIRPGWDLLLVDDLVTSGKTMLAMAEVVRAEGGVVKHALVLLDRMEGARERLRKQGIVLHQVTDVLELADTLLSMELIEKKDFRGITRAVGAASRP